MQSEAEVLSGAAHSGAAQSSPPSSVARKLLILEELCERRVHALSKVVDLVVDLEVVRFGDEGRDLLPTAPRGRR